MKVEFDPRKEQKNIKKHGFDFSLAEPLLNSSFVVEAYDRFEGGEHRYHVLAPAGQRVMLIVYADPDEDDDIVQVIGLRRATPTESNYYEQQREALYRK